MPTLLADIARLALGETAVSPFALPNGALFAALLLPAVGLVKLVGLVLLGTPGQNRIIHRNKKQPRVKKAGLKRFRIFRQ